MKKSFYMFLSAASLLSAGPLSVSLLPYGAFLNYGGDTAKEDGYVGGLYASIFYSPNKLELSAEQTHITYNDGSPALNQTDMTAIYTYYQGYHLACKAGIHHLIGDDDATDGGIVGILGVTWYDYLKYDTGVDLYYSRYDNSDPSLTIWQIRPHAGYHFGNYYSADGSFYLEGEYNYIGIEDARLHGLKDSYHSGGLSLSNYKGPWTTTVKGWTGKKVYAVDNGGFTVYNLGEEYKAGAGISVDYAVNPKTHFKIQYDYSKFEQNGNEAYSSTVAAIFGYTF